MSGRIGWALVAMTLGAACAASPGVDVEDSSRLDRGVPTTGAPAVPSADSVPAPTPTTRSPSTTERPTTAPEDTTPPTSESPDVESTTPGAGSSDDLAGVGDSLYPELGNGGYDVAHYSLAIEVDVERNEISGVAEIEATSTDRLDVFHLDLLGLEVLEVTVDGSEAAVERVEQELVITPSVAIPAATAFDVVVRYLGTPEPIVDPSFPYDTIGWQERDGTVYVVSEPSGAMSWFPSNNHPIDKATFDFAITTDSDLTVVANGVLDGVEDAGGGKSTTTWRMNDPMTTYLAAVYIGDFELRESVTDDGLRIRNYFPPALADDLVADFGFTADVIDFTATLLDAPYPFDEYGSIVLPFSLGFALENQTISVHGVDGTDSTTVAHEIVHQWVGNSISIGDWQDIWLNEGFATYLTYLYFEDRGGANSIGPEGMYAALSGDSIAPAEVPVEELFGLSSYFRGGLALHALRVEVGDAVFGEILTAYAARFTGGDLRTEDFLDLVEGIAGSDAVAVLDAWLYGDALPAFPE